MWFVDPSLSLIGYRWSQRASPPRVESCFPRCDAHSAVLRAEQCETLAPGPHQTDSASCIMLDAGRLLPPIPFEAPLSNITADMTVSEGFLPDSSDALNQSHQFGQVIQIWRRQCPLGPLCSQSHAAQCHTQRQNGQVPSQRAGPVPTAWLGENGQFRCGVENCRSRSKALAQHLRSVCCWRRWCS